MRPLKIEGKVARIMLALRPGVMTMEQMTERFDACPASQVARLKVEGLVEERNTEPVTFALTAKGREMCPTRRALYAAADGILRAKDQRELRKKHKGGARA